MEPSTLFWQHWIHLGINLGTNISDIEEDLYGSFLCVTCVVGGDITRIHDMHGSVRCSDRSKRNYFVMDRVFC